jgi:hypothetical protein
VSHVWKCVRAAVDAAIRAKKEFRDLELQLRHTWTRDISLRRYKNLFFYWGKWCAQGDDFRTFLGQFVATLPQIELPAGLNL